MKSKLYLLATFLLVVVTGCDKNEIIEKQPDLTDNRSLTLTASMPDESATQTRVAFTQDGKDIKLIWENEDQIQLCFIQGETKEKRTVTVKNISSDGKRADFDINVPESFAMGTFDLYGVYGGQGLDDTDPSIAVLPATPWQTYTGLEGVQSRKDVMMTFKATGLDVDAPSATVSFRHIGSLFCVKLKNGSAGSWNSIARVQLTAATDGWAYNNSGDEGARYDLQAESFVSGSPTNSAILFDNNSKDMGLDEINEFWAWYPPVPDVNWPELRLEVYNPESVKIASSANRKAARVAPTAAGKAYYFYAFWDGSKLNFTDDTFTPPLSIDDLTATGNLMHAASAGHGFIGMVYSKGDNKVYYNAAQTSGTWRGEVELGAGAEARLAIDRSGYPHVVYTSADNKIAYLKYNGTEWSTAVYIESMNHGGTGACKKPDIDVDASGYAHITYTDTRGSSGDAWFRDDIMYAVNSLGDFAKTLIFRGYYENWGGSAYWGEYYNNGSYIALNALGDYYIMAHHQNYDRSGGGTAYNTYTVEIKSGTGAFGKTTGTSGNQHAIYDLTFNDTDVIALYKAANTNYSATISVTGTVASFTNVQSITTAVTPHSLSATSGLSGVTTIAGLAASSKLFTKYNAYEFTDTGVTVKANTKVMAANVGGVFYSVYTDNADSKIKIKAIPTGI
ncbi:hypothetical protein [Proteiniphilum sp.]|uniref:hypothetical protein n=1 Tax=Proteiniphilum sp. TaxID=1926877 RepID=UPI002B1F58F5|nr:hypothetical protein [Proteiniphilum sp.]MEA4917645.1 hypothetical protein [Proteiniphilum sp.]